MGYPPSFGVHNLICKLNFNFISFPFYSQKDIAEELELRIRKTISGHRVS